MKTLKLSDKIDLLKKLTKAQKLEILGELTILNNIVSNFSEAKTDLGWENIDAKYLELRIKIENQ